MIKRYTYKDQEGREESIYATSYHSALIYFRKTLNLKGRSFCENRNENPRLYKFSQEGKPVFCITILEERNF